MFDYNPYMCQYQYYPAYSNQNRHIASIEQIKGQMKLFGKAEVIAEPDMAGLTVGVVSQGMDLKRLIADNSLKVQKIVSALKKLGIDEKDIRTERYSVEPVYDYVDGKQIFKGYRVTNNITVTIRDIDKVGDIIDSAAAEGANVIGRLQFSLSNPEEYYKQALALAVQSAIDKAVHLEETMDIIVNKVPEKITEENNGYNEILHPKAFQLAEAATPIYSGQIKIQASVETVFNYTAK